MKKQIHKLNIVLLALLCAVVFPMTAFAAEKEIAAATIPVSVSVSGEAGTQESDIPSETYTFQISALNDAPMPASSTLTIQGAGTAEFSISYSSVGVYRYMVSQNADGLTGENSSCNDRGHYDSSVYYVNVTVTNTEDGGYGVVVAAHKGSSEATKSDILFNNTYDPVPYKSLTVRKTWTDNMAKRPASINVQLYDGDKVVDAVQLNAENGWTYTWETLDSYGDHSWDVKELPVTGYTASYSVDADGTIHIHNTGASGTTLIQTGQLNWPIPVLTILGAGLILGGVFVLTRKKEKTNE